MKAKSIFQNLPSSAFLISLAVVCLVTAFGCGGPHQASQSPHATKSPTNWLSVDVTFSATADEAMRARSLNDIEKMLVKSASTQIKDPTYCPTIRVFKMQGNTQLYRVTVVNTFVPNGPNPPKTFEALSYTSTVCDTCPGQTCRCPNVCPPCQTLRSLVGSSTGIESIVTVDGGSSW